ncbi:hypothetical protein J6590_009756 [Homalodisca vitripennis]|nr:hypothetical protein J6590_009756 [Homalodisca vitripennis]
MLLFQEERQFKLRRFVKDVHKFVEEKCQVEKPVMVCKPATPLQVHKSNKKIKPVQRNVKRGLFQNGIQTRFYCRGMTQKEMTARLDENLQEIIALANNKENECQCQHHYRKSSFVADEMTVARPPLQVLTPRHRDKGGGGGALEHVDWFDDMSYSSPTKWESPELPSTMTSIHREHAVDRSIDKPRIKEFDSELYSEFVRIITVSSSKSKSLQFKSKSKLL